MGSSAVGATAIDAMVLGKRAHERQVMTILESATQDQANLNHVKKQSELAAKTSGVGVHLNVMA